MTFHAETHVPDAYPCPESPATVADPGDAHTVRLTPRKYWGESKAPTFTYPASRA